MRPRSTPQCRQVAGEQWPGSAEIAPTGSPCATAVPAATEDDTGSKVLRRPPEWASEHIVQAVHMPLDHLAETAGSLNRDSKVAVLCAGGFRSSIAASVLEQMGFQKVSNVIGGMTAWNNAKLLVA